MKMRSISKNFRRTPASEDLSIRFVNTVAWRLREPSEERLGSPAALLEWLERNGVARPEDCSLRDAWAAHPSKAARVYATAIRLREAIYQLFVARIRGHPPPAAALTSFSEFLLCRRSTLRIDWEAGQLIWRTRLEGGQPLDLLRPIALSAAELMTGHRAHKLRQCQDDRGCGWLFVDESRLQNRRWCSMGDCGNLAKARRHRESVRKTARRRTPRMK
jgi:predicted RNA-binding Zn ribbon-like protein